jgi:hypothetical protein
MIPFPAELGAAGTAGGAVWPDLLAAVGGPAWASRLICAVADSDRAAFGGPTTLRCRVVG